MLFEFGRQEDVESSAAYVQRVDACRVLFSTMGEYVDVRPSFDLLVRVVFGVWSKRDRGIGWEIGGRGLDIEASAAVMGTLPVLVIGRGFDLDLRPLIIEILGRPDRPNSVDTVQGGADQPFCQNCPINVAQDVREGPSPKVSYRLSRL